MKLGVALPIVDIGSEPATLREFAQVAEEIGYQGIAAPDHVLGINVPSRPDWTQGRARSTYWYHDPFVLFGFLAGCAHIADFSTQVLILPRNPRPC
jgi:alkanesulfonate monooxygenase SsuD/methylene tetrahydromethanopterin reductase-like flavin-dependent oxidoreductase (luciferase family)